MMSGQGLYDDDMSSLVFAQMSKKNLSKKVIKKYGHKLDWHLVSRFSELDVELVEMFKDKIDWYVFSKYQNLSAKMIDKYHPYLHFDGVYQNEHVLRNMPAFQPNNMLFNSSKDLPQPLGHWFYRTVLSLPFRKQFDNIQPWIAMEPYLSFISLSGCTYLSIEMMEHYEDRLCWDRICQRVELSEAFLERFKHKLIWMHLSVNRNWKMELLEKHFSKIDKHVFLLYGLGSVVLAKRGINVLEVRDVKVDKNGIHITMNQ